MDIDADRLAKALRTMATRSRFCVSGELRDLVVAILWDFIDRRRQAAPLFTVDEYRPDGNGILRTVAETADRSIAEAAYRTACQEHPDRNIKLRTGIRVIRAAIEDGKRIPMTADQPGRDQRAAMPAKEP